MVASDAAVDSSILVEPSSVRECANIIVTSASKRFPLDKSIVNADLCLV